MNPNNTEIRLDINKRYLDKKGDLIIHLGYNQNNKDACEII